jgi:hypothetical protein
MYISSVDETSNTRQYFEEFLKLMGKQYYAKYRRLSVNQPESVGSNNASSTTSSGSDQSSFNPYDLSSNDDEYLMSQNLAEITPGHSYRAACLLAAARLYFNSLPEEPKNWGQINPNCNNYHSNLVGISCTFWLPDITDSWH